MAMQPGDPGFIRPPKLFMPMHVWQKLMAYVQACPVEISGFGLLDLCNGDLMVDDVYILEQVAGPGSVEVSEETLHRHLFEMERDGGNSGRLRLQWHSHVNMEAYFSSVDLRNIEDYQADWMVSLVLNKRGEFDLRLDMFRPYRAWTPLQLRVRVPSDVLIQDECRREIARKVKQHRPLLPNRSVRQDDVLLFAGSLEPLALRVGDD